MPRRRFAEEVQSPEALKARDDLRQWRLSTPMSHFEGIKKKFNSAGINVFAYCVNGMGDDFTSDEIDVMFAQAKALGASTISSLHNRKHRPETRTISPA